MSSSITYVVGSVIPTGYWNCMKSLDLITDMYRFLGSVAVVPISVLTVDSVSKPHGRTNGSL